MKYDVEKLKRQIELEEEGMALGIKRYRDKVRTSPLSDLPPGIVLTKKCVEPLAEAIRRFKLPTPGGGRLVHTRKFLNQFDDDELAYITTRKIINAIAEMEPLQRVAITLAEMLKDQLEYKKFKEQAPGYLYKLEQSLKASKHQGYKRTVIMYAKRKLGIEDEKWTQQDKLHIGVKLIDLFIQSTGLAEKVRRSRKPLQFNKNSKDMYILQATPEAENWIEEAHAQCELLSPVYLPMIVPPRPWLTPFDGGYINNEKTMKFKLVKTRDKDTLLALADHDMPKVYRALNALQETPWRINTFILDVLKQAWETGNGMAGLPVRDMPPLPPTPWDSDEEFQRMKKETPEIVKEWKHKASKIYDRQFREESKRIAVMQKIWIGEKFRDEPEIYFVWCMDWRGRMYPLQNFVNPQADDSGKALLEFAVGKPLGKNGAKWLAIRVANEFGIDKVSFEERIQWTKDHEALIRDSVENPMDGQRFWCEADNPFQFLAACREWVGYLDEGESFVSHLPIALDGSCNGLQNFSALLLDEVGGKAVNLVPSDKPSDIYAEVAEVLNRMVEEDAKRGDENAKIWLGKIDRGITKRGVMTTPYGAKLYGLKDQLMAELDKRDTATATYLGVEDNFEPCVYLGKRLYEAIGQVVVAAREAMDWLQEAAKIAAKADIPIIWTTPAGFKVRQLYPKQRLKQIATFWGGIRVDLGLNVDTDKVDKVKQANGISPNFIHSLDASHLQLTVNMCLDEGITNFSMVHDSYATHAADTDALARILREAFIKQYTDYDVLERFRDELIAQLPAELAEKIPPLPSKGTLNLEKVRDSVYFFA